MKQLYILLVVLVLAGMCLLTGCESSSNQAEQSSAASAPAPKPPSLYSGLQAFNTAKALALKWAPDAIPVKLESQVNSESNGQGGKATVWRAGFISPSQRTLKFFLCSGSRLHGAPPYGTSVDTEEPYGGDVASYGFQDIFLKVDSDKAYEVAQEHGGADLIKKNPDQPVTYFVVWNPKQKALFWYVMYGKDKASSVGVGMVNALTGTFAGASK